MAQPPGAVTVAGPFPADGPATLEAVKLLLRITGTADDDLIGAAVAAVNVFVRRLPVRGLVVWPMLEWPADTSYGATLLAGRLYRRRNSPAGVESFSDMGGAVYVQRNDPDIAMMLGLGAYARPMVG